mmetsp:Transcript_25441/g.48206  ORF Transcript_25441/g.48206 Transcript_25441/m.48206 type:complete len:255 (+) Transcript_25441:113-877(+)
MTTTATTSSSAVTTQTVVFLRHGVAEHNVRGANLTSPTLWDPSLTLEGKVSAVRAGETIKQWWKQQSTQQFTQQWTAAASSGSSSKIVNKIDLIVCSPLSRTLQTAALAFVPDPPYATASAAPPLVCVEAVREAYGVHYPDRRRKRSVLMKQWPAVQFDNSMPEEDVYWSPTQRETYDNVRDRVQAFLQWLRTRPERNICVVSHGVWIETCLQAFGSPPGALGNRRVYNCDAYAVKLVSNEGRVLSLADVTLIT